MFLSSLAAVVAVSLTTYCGGAALLRLGDRYRSQLTVRLRELAPQKAPVERPNGNVPLVKSSKPQPSTTQTKKSNLWLTDSEEDRRRHQARLVQAGIYNPKTLSAFFIVKTALLLAPPAIALVAGSLGFVNLRIGVVWGLVAGAAGMVAPSLWLEQRIQRRHCHFRRSLADFLDLMIVCLEGGLSLQGTLQRVGDELRIAYPDLALELTIVQRDMSLGASIDSALRRFADRTGYEGIRSLSTFVRESQRFGTRLSDALRLHADMLRSQRESEAEEKAQKAAVKVLIPMLLLILPAVFVVLAGPAALQIQKAFSK